MINVDEEISKLINPEPLSSDAYLGLHDNSIILKYGSVSLRTVLQMINYIFVPIAT